MNRIGIHTFIISESTPYDNHVAISIETPDGERFFGLYPPASKYLLQEEKDRAYDEGGSDIHESVDARRQPRPTYSHYVEIDEAQTRNLLDFVETPQRYGARHNNCLTWSLKAWELTTGKELDATEIAHDPIDGTERAYQTPTGLENHLRGHGRAKPDEPERNSESSIMPGPFARFFSRVKGQFHSDTGAKPIDDRKPGRSEYQPGSHKPAPKEPGREKDDRGGRGD